MQNIKIIMKLDTKIPSVDIWSSSSTLFETQAAITLCDVGNI